MTNTARVTRIELDTLNGLAVEVTVARVPAYMRRDVPQADDLPDDIRVALLEWLGAETR